MPRKRKPEKKEYKPTQDHHFMGKLRSIFETHPTLLFNPKQIARKLELKGKNREEFALKALCELENRGVITQANPAHFCLKVEHKEFITGRVDHVNPRFAFIVNPDGNDVKVSSTNLMHAMDGDLVTVGINPHSKGKNPEGRVINIIERKLKEIIGVIQIEGKFAFVKPDSKKIHTDIYISPKNINDAPSGTKVLVKITGFPKEGYRAEGKVIEVVGKPGEHATEMFSIINEFGLPASFSKKVEEAAEQLPVDISAKEIAKRKDYRDVLTFTIDPIDAKDFDDAISIKPLDNGNIEIGVHIADVSHYVEEGSILDEEALERATSVYLVDRVIPMLPEKISNILCSLRPHEDKLAFSVIFELDQHAGIVNTWYGRTVIHSDRRFTYEEAQQVLETQEGDFVPEITLLNDLAKKFRDRRFRDGAINFETQELRVVLDENFKPIKVVPRERKDAHKLVEEFMLLANKSVATYIYNLKEKFGKAPTMVYRVHEEPDPEKIITFKNFAMKFGHDLDTMHLASSLNTLVSNIEGKPEENLLQNLAIRAMSKAKYTTEKLGHYGLAFKHYTHFTSPIRRYPDVLAHRLLQHYLDGGKSMLPDPIEEMCKQSSIREKVAADAERASIKLKQVEYMSQFKNQELMGVISGLTENGFYVEIKDTACEGMVRMADLPNDYFIYDAERLQIYGQRSNRTFTFGDVVKVKIVKTNLVARTIDLELVD